MITIEGERKGERERGERAEKERWRKREGKEGKKREGERERVKGSPWSALVNQLFANFAPPAKSEKNCQRNFRLELVVTTAICFYLFLSAIFILSIFLFHR